MHCLDLGSMRKLLILYLKYGLFDQAVADQFIKLAVKYVPSDFTRKPRPLKLLDHYKAAELRMFALYLAIVMFKESNMSRQDYETFLLFFCGYRILMGENGNCTTEDCDLSDNLLTQLVKRFHEKFSECSFNFHCLLHLADIVRKNGPLYRYSAYPFENYYQLFRQWIRKPSDILKQIWQRWNQNKGLVLKKSIKKRKEFDSFHVDSNMRNNYIMTTNGDLVMITRKIVNLQNISYIGRKFTSREPFFSSPINSEMLNIYMVSEESLSNDLINIEMVDIKSKMFKVPYNNNFVVLPLLHY